MAVEDLAEDVIEDSELSDEDYAEQVSEEIDDLNSDDGVPTYNELNPELVEEVTEVPAEGVAEESATGAVEEVAEIPAHIQAKFDQYEERITSLQRDEGEEQARAKAMFMRHVKQDTEAATKAYMDVDGLSESEAIAKVDSEIAQSRASGELLTLARAYGVKVTTPEEQSTSNISKRLEALETAGQPAPAAAPMAKVTRINPQKVVRARTNAPGKGNPQDRISARYRAGIRDKETMEYARKQYA
jgi:hypothetical protein